MEERDLFSKYLLEKGLCCTCNSPLKDSKHVNLVQLNRVATWKTPIWGNILSESQELKYALAVVCDNCISPEKMNEIKFAIEIEMSGNTPSNIYYHAVENLEKGSPTFSEEVKMQLEADAQRDELLNIMYATIPGDEIALATRGLETAEEINAKALRQSGHYVMLVNKGYIKGLKNPKDRQHHDFINQLMIVKEEKKQTIVIQDIHVTEDEVIYLKEMMAGIEIIAWIVEDMKNPTEEATEKIIQIIKKLKEDGNDVR